MDAGEAREASTDSESQLSCDSVSSLAVELPVSETEERTNFITIESPHLDLATKGRRSKLLKLYPGGLPPLPKLGSKPAANVDLSLPEEKPFIDEWLGKKFAHVKKPVRTEVTILKGTSAKQKVQRDLLSSLAAKRKKEQERRRELYQEDNEDILSKDDEEEEEILPIKKKQTRPKPVSEDSDDDEDYNADEEEEVDDEDVSDEEAGDGNASDAEESTLNADKIPETAPVHTTNGAMPLSYTQSEDLFASQNVRGSSVPHNLVPSLPTTSTSSGMTLKEPFTELPASEQFPSSLSQWIDNNGSSVDGLTDVVSESFVSKVLKTAPDRDELGSVDDDDLLLLCSGKFDAGFSIPPDGRNINNHVKSVEEVPTEAPDEDIVQPALKSKRKRLMDSDDEDETPKKEELVLEETPQLPETQELVQNEVNLAEEEASHSKKRAVLLSDGEDEEETGVVENEEENFIDEEAEIEGEQDAKTNQNDEEGEYDSDDEMAVYRRIQDQEHKRKMNKESYFDDEASLSGDDVGSDLDEEMEGMDEYEKEAGDEEDFDTDEIRRQNHKHYLKEEQKRIHREIAQLQDRLLADGDLTGVETNRTFRIKLREDTEQTAVGEEEGSQETLEVDDEEEARQRAEAVKYKVQMQELLASAVVEEPDNSQDPLEFAATAALRAAVEPTKQPIAKVSLLHKAPLGNIFKELSSNIAVKQLYTRTDDQPAAAKRRIDASQPDSSSAKRTKTLLGDLD